MTVMQNKVNVYNGLNAQVLDDDKDMNEMLKEMFELSGLPNVTFFQQSDLFVDAMNEKVHLCILDQVLKTSSPKLQGIDVAKIVRVRWPKCQIIFVSGTSDPAILKDIIRLRPEGYVDKDEKNYFGRVVEEVTKCLGSIRGNMEFATRLELYSNENES